MDAAEGGQADTEVALMEPQCEGCGNRCVELYPQGVHLLCAVCLEID